MNRRQVLRAAGVSLTLPWMESVARAATARPPRRLMVVFFDNGVVPARWWPTGAGPGFVLSDPLSSLEPHRAHLTILKNVNQADPPYTKRPHGRCTTAFLTARTPNNPETKKLFASISFDQVLADALGHETLIPSLQLSAPDESDIVYSNAVSWRKEGSPLLPEVNPRLVLEQLFGGNPPFANNQFTGPGKGGAADPARKSILDAVLAQTSVLRLRLASGDRAKLDEFLSSVRSVEKRVASAARQNRAMIDDTQADPYAWAEFDLPEGLPVAEMFEQRARLMLDLAVLAFQTDRTRFITFMLTRGGSNVTYPQLGLPNSHHEISHHANEPLKMGQLTRINKFHTEFFAHLLQRLSTVREGDGTLLDSTVALFGCGMGDGNLHDRFSVPMILAGRGGGILQPRGLVDLQGAHVGRIYVELINRFGVSRDGLGDSTGRLESL